MRKQRPTKPRGRPPKYGDAAMKAISLHLPRETIEILKELADEASLKVDNRRTGYNSLATQVLIIFAEERRVVFDEFYFEPIKKKAK